TAPGHWAGPQSVAQRATHLVPAQQEVLPGFEGAQRSVHLVSTVHLPKQTGVQEEVDVGLPLLFAVLRERILGAAEYGHALLVHLEHLPKNMNSSCTDHPLTWDVLLRALCFCCIRGLLVVGIGATSRRGQYGKGQQTSSTSVEPTKKINHNAAQQKTTQDSAETTHHTNSSTIRFDLVVDVQVCGMLCSYTAISKSMCGVWVVAPFFVLHLSTAQVHDSPTARTLASCSSLTTKDTGTGTNRGASAFALFDPSIST